jgi:prepilin-type N-terminal cleavage/methylation domain-containing protein
MNFLMHKKGFTLIELLVVIAIIGVLSSIVIASLNRAKDRNRYVKTLEDMRNIARAAESFANDNGGSYPADVGPNGTPPGVVPNYISAWPKSPCSTLTYDWENWPQANALPVVRMTVRNLATTPLYHYCVSPDPSRCLNGDGSQNLQTVANKTLVCP